MIEGVFSGISAQIIGSANVCANKEGGFIFDSLLSGLIKGKESAPGMQEESSVSPELKDPEESGDQQTREQAHMNPFPYRILQNGKSTASVRNVPTDENADQTGTWLTNVAEKHLVIANKLDCSASAVVTPTQSVQIEDSSRIERLPFSEGAEHDLMRQTDYDFPLEEGDYPKEGVDLETKEQTYINPFSYRIFQYSKSSASVSDDSADEKADKTGGRLDYFAPAVETSERPAQIEDSSRMASLPFSEDTIANSEIGPQADERTSTPESNGVRASKEKQFYSTSYISPSQHPERSLVGPEIRLEQKSENSLDPYSPAQVNDLLKDTPTMPSEQKMTQSKRAFPLQESNPLDESLTNFPEMAATVDADSEATGIEQSTELQPRETAIRLTIVDEEKKVDQSEKTAKIPDSNGNKAPLNQGPLIRELVTDNLFGNKPLKVTASHIKDIQKTIEMQIEKTPALGNTVVKILLTPDNIGDIHVQLVKTKESITAFLHVQDAETKGLLEEQLPLLMEPFRHSVSESTISLKVVTDASLAFSFSQEPDRGNQKNERQESKKRTTRDKPETDESPKAKQTIRGLSLLA